MERTVSLATGIDIAIEEAGPRDGDAVVLIHGFPETKYSWRHQVPVLAAAGYRAIALDCRGYGGSSKPEELDAYRIDHVVADLMGLIDAEGLERPALVGHDWGSIIMWSAAVMHPDAFRALVSLNVPYRGWSVGFPRIDYIREHLMDRFGYVVYFQDEGRVEESFAADPEAWLQRIYLPFAGRPDFLTEEELGHFVAAFTEGGISGPINYYRNIDANHDTLAGFENAAIETPVLMVIADADPVLPASLVEGMERWLPKLTVAPIEGAGHWVQQERPAEVNDALLGFLSDLD